MTGGRLADGLQGRLVAPDAAQARAWLARVEALARTHVGERWEAWLDETTKRRYADVSRAQAR